MEIAAETKMGRDVSIGKLKLVPSLPLLAFPSLPSAILVSPTPAIAVLQTVAMGATGKSHHHAVIFTYGTLKRGFSNHMLLQEMMRSDDAVFVSSATTVDRFPLVCGPYRVPFLLNLRGAGHSVSGELYAVSADGLRRIDELEGTARGHYERLPIEVSSDDEPLVRAQAYFAHRSYAEELWKKNGEEGLCSYSEKETKGYVKRKDRPQNLTFLEQIRRFVSSDVSD